MTVCPQCSDALEGLATFCHTCQAYIADMGSSDVHGRELLEKGQRVVHLGADTRPEAEIRLAIRRALELLDFDLYDFEQNRPTRQTAGIADLFAVGHGRCAWIEVKTTKGKQSEAQVVFERRVMENGGFYLVMRHEDDAIRWAETVREAAA